LTISDVDKFFVETKCYLPYRITVLCKYGRGRVKFSDYNFEVTAYLGNALFLSPVPIVSKKATSKKEIEEKSKLYKFITSRL